LSSLGGGGINVIPVVRCVGQPVLRESAGPGGRVGGYARRKTPEEFSGVRLPGGCGSLAFK